MSATFAYEDPLSRASAQLVGVRAQTGYVMREMGRNIWSSGKGFAKVGALYSGVECCIEGVGGDLTFFPASFFLSFFTAAGSPGRVKYRVCH
jgi:hypothetical protein